MKIETIDDMAPVMGADGEFHAQDEAVDLSGTKPEAWVALGFFWLLGATVFYQFFTRYVLQDSAAWTEEIARYLLIVVVFVGASMGVRRNTHIHVEFLYRYVPAAVGRVMSTFVDVVRVAFFAYATYLSSLLIPRMNNLKMTMIDVPVSVIYSFVMAGFVLMTIRAVQVAVRHWRQGWSVLERPGDVGE